MQENLNLVWQNASNYRKKNINNILSLKDITIIKNIIRCSSEIKDQVITLKLPAIVINNDNLFSTFIESIRLLELCGAKIVIIQDNVNLEDFSVDKNLLKKIENINLKNHIMMEMTSSYINKLIVTKLSSVGCYAIGISGKDANLIQAKKSKLSSRRTINNDVIGIDFVNEPVIINPEILLNFEDNNIIPVISPVANDEAEVSHLLDVNLTTMVVSYSIGADHLILPYEKPSNILFDQKVGDLYTLQSMFNQESNFINKELIRVAINAIKHDVGCVHFVNSTVPYSILHTIFASYIDQKYNNIKR